MSAFEYTLLAILLIGSVAIVVYVYPKLWRAAQAEKQRTRNEPKSLALTWPTEAPVFNLSGSVPASAHVWFARHQSIERDNIAWLVDVMTHDAMRTEPFLIAYYTLYTIDFDKALGSLFERHAVRTHVSSTSLLKPLVLKAKEEHPPINSIRYTEPESSSEELSNLLAQQRP